MYNSGAFAGLTKARLSDFNYGVEDVQLADVSGGVESATRRTATFSYDDTCFGQTPDGVYRRLASCSGQCAQLWFRPFVWKQSEGGGTSIPPGGMLQALSVTMGGGIGALDVVDDQASQAAGSIVKVADQLPLASPGFTWYLLRPHPISNDWEGRDDTNLALRTLWLPSEIGPVSYQFTVNTCDLELQFYFQTQGWVVPLP